MDTTKGASQSIAPVLLERSTLVNLPAPEVATFLESEITPWGRFEVLEEERAYSLEYSGRLWTLELSPHADGRRTLIKMSWDEDEAKQSRKDAEADSEVGTSFLSRINPLAGKALPVLDLRKLKSLLETGELASIEGQPHGERSRVGSFFENFGDLLLQKIQSKTELPASAHEEAPLALDNSEAAPKTILRKEARA